MRKHVSGSRGGSFLTVLVVILLPLCLLRDLSKLAFSSFFGLACEAGVVVFMIVRLVTGEYAPGGEFYNSQEPGTQLSWGDGDGPEILAFDWSVFVLMLGCVGRHGAKPSWRKHGGFYHQLRRRSSRSFLRATAGGYSIAVLLFATCMIVGYLTFGTNCQGNILHNYSPHDTWATVSRVAMLLATICGFPIAFTGLRTAALQLCGCGHRRRYWVPITTCSKVSVGLGLLLTIAGIALLLVGAMSLTNISLNVSAGIDGSTTGTLAAPSDLNCPYIILIGQDSACSDFQASATTTAGTLDTAVCGSEDLPEDGEGRAPAQRSLQDAKTAMCRCGKTCSKVSVGLGLLLTIAGIALLLVGAMSLTSISLNVSAGIDGTTTGTLAAPSDLNCPYIILIGTLGTDSACSDFQASATTTAGTLDTAVCGSEELPEDGEGRRPGQRTLQDAPCRHQNLDWTIGTSETKLTDLKMAAQLNFAADGDATVASSEDMWSMQLCDVFSELFAQAGRAIIMVAAGAVILVAGLVTFFIGLCCCCLLGSVLTDLGIVNSLGGATLGSLIELIFPGLMIMWTFSASQSKDQQPIVFAGPYCTSTIPLALLVRRPHALHVEETDVTEVFGRFEGRHGARLLTGLGVALLCFGTSIVLAVTVFKMDL
eukprot:g12262.t1